jgi:hypothetical protein
MANGGAPPLSQPTSRPCEGLAPGDHSRTQLTMGPFFSLRNYLPVCLCHSPRGRDRDRWLGFTRYTTREAKYSTR